MADPTMMSWSASLQTYKDNKIIDQVDLDVEICTRDHIDKFYELSKNEKTSVNKLLDKQILYCISEG